MKNRNQRRKQISLEYPLICELRKVCGKLEMETGASISLAYLAKGIIVDFLTALRELPPNQELQELIYSTIGGYRPTQREFFLPMPGIDSGDAEDDESGIPAEEKDESPITQEQGEQSCQSQQNNGNAADTSSAPATSQPSSE